MLRHRLVLVLSPVSAPADASARHPTVADQEQLAELMFHAYRGTIDDGGETLADAHVEARKFFDGGYGPLSLGCSEVTERDGRIVCATLVTRWEGVPLLAMTMTHPEWKRRGLARASMLRVINMLCEHGEREVHLAVTAGNPAETMYRQLGFADFVRG